MNYQTARAVAGALIALSRRADLWPVAIRQTRRTIPARWWTFRPYLPVPPRRYLKFRLVTAYGADGSVPASGRPGMDLAEDLIAYLEWCKE